MSAKNIWGVIGGAFTGASLGYQLGGYYGAIIGAVIGAALGYYLSTLEMQVEGFNNPEKEHLGIADCQIGLPIPDVLGTLRIGGNFLWFDSERTEDRLADAMAEDGKGKGGKSSESGLVTVMGYKYYASWMLGLCLGPVDAVYTIYRHNEIVWEGEILRTSGNPATINVPALGIIYFFFGTSNQPAPASVSNKYAEWLADTSQHSGRDLSTYGLNYPNICYALFHDCYIGTTNQVPVITFTIRKTPTCSFDSGDSYKQIETYEYNPAHAIWYLLETRAGLSGSSWMNSSNFRSMAQAMYSEKRGICALVASNDTLMDAIANILRHVFGVLYTDANGKINLKLIMRSYDAGTLLEFDENSILEPPQVARRAWNKTYNEVKVEYTKLVIRTDGIIENQEMAGLGL